MTRREGTAGLQTGIAAAGGAGRNPQGRDEAA